MKKITNFTLLIIATVIWGFSFVASKWVLVEYTPLWANSLRFITAGIIAVPILLLLKTFRKGWKVLLYPLIPSILLFAAVLFQTLGLKYTSVAKCSFLSTLYVVFTPLICMLFLGKRYQKSYWISVGIGILGVALLCDLSFYNFNLGDILSIFSALTGATQILAIEKLTKKYPSSIELNSLQCFYIGLYSLLTAWYFDGPINLTPLLQIGTLGGTSPLTGVIITGVFSSLLAFSIQAHTQKVIPAHIVSVIYLLESPIASIAGHFVLGEIMSNVAIMGSVLVLVSAGMVPLMAQEVPEEGMLVGNDTGNTSFDTISINAMDEGIGDIVRIEVKGIEEEDLAAEGELAGNISVNDIKLEQGQRKR